MLVRETDRQTERRSRRKDAGGTVAGATSRLVGNRAHVTPPLSPAKSQRGVGRAHLQRASSWQRGVTTRTARRSGATGDGGRRGCSSHSEVMSV